MEIIHASPQGHADIAHGSLKSYLTGFAFSIVLTIVPFWMVMHPDMFSTSILPSILTAAVVQIVVHLIYFLHMNGRSDQRWNTLAFAFTVLVIVMVVGGSVWIMAHAMYNMMPMPDLTHQQ